MSLLILVAAATSPTFSAAIPIHRDSWISPVIDFPRRGINRESYTLVTTEMVINPRGGVIDCRSRVVAGNPGMGPYTCGLLRKRALFKPARDAAGQRVYGLNREAITWMMVEKLPSSFEPPSASHFAVRVPSLPPGTKRPAKASIQFAVDAAGVVGECRPMAEDDKPALALIACGSIKSVGPVQAARDKKGVAVPSIQNAIVELVTAR
jgi:hypothetical protein